MNASMKLYKAAHEWPRCGAGWPTGDAEVAAEAQRDGLDEQGRTPEVAAECEAEWAAWKVRAVVLEQQAAAAAEALIVRALADSSGDVKRFIAHFPGGATDSDILRFDPTNKVVRSFGRLGVKTKRGGNYVC